MTNQIQTFDGVYAVQQLNDKGETMDWSIAIQPEVNLSLQRALWKDGGRGRAVDYQIISDLKIEYSNPVMEEKKSTTPLSARKITILSSLNNETFILEPLTLGYYQEKIKERIGGHPDFTSEDEMKTFFIKLAKG